MKINSFKYLNDVTAGRSGDNSFRLYDPELAKKITNDARKTMISLNEILSGNAKGGLVGKRLVVMHANSGGLQSRICESLQSNIEELPRIVESELEEDNL